MLRLNIFIILLFVQFLPMESKSQTSDWLPMDEGLLCDSFASPEVNHLFVDTLNNLIYASGGMVHDGYCQSLRSIGFWNGNTWESVGESDLIGGSASIIFNGELIASAPIIFDEQEWETVSYTYRWQDEQWVTINNAPKNKINEFRKLDDLLYTVGNSSNCGTDTSEMVCVYDGENWTPIGLIPEILSGQPSTITEFDDELYVGGNMRFINGLGEHTFQLCKWTGENYRNLGGGLDSTYLNSIVYDIEAYKGKLYIAGQLKLPGNSTQLGLVTWDGESLEPANPMPNARVYRLLTHDGALYAAGGFTEIAGEHAEHLARFDGSDWVSLNTDSLFAKGGYYQGQFFTTAIRGMAVMQDTMYIAGDFYRINQDTVRLVAKMNKNLTTDFPPLTNDMPEENHFDFDFELSPNPSSGELKISWTQSKNSKAELLIRDSRGRTISKIDLGNRQRGQNDEFLQLNNLGPGVYLIQVQTTFGMATQRWVKVE